MKSRTVLYADDGYVLTNGEIYGKTLFLADSASAIDFYEITDEEYQAVLDAQAAEVPL